MILETRGVANNTLDYQLNLTLSFARILYLNRLNVFLRTRKAYHYILYLNHLKLHLVVLLYHFFSRTMSVQYHIAHLLLFLVSFKQGYSKKEVFLLSLNNQLL